MMIVVASLQGENGRVDIYTDSQISVYYLN